jgi:hypothetical protein
MSAKRSRVRASRLAIVVALVATLLSVGSQIPSRAKQSATPDPIVTGPVTGGKGVFGGMRYDVTQYGYEAREFFFEGTARAYDTIAPDAQYRTRMIAWTPTDPRRFNGTTIVEWAELAGYELAPELSFQSPMLVDEGYAFVLVSAQQAGVCTDTPAGCAPTSLKGYDPERYGSLSHPGDAYSFDIFSQALKAIKEPSSIAPLGELSTKVLIAEGFQVMDRGAGVPDHVGMLNEYITSGADADAALADAFLIDTGEPVDPAITYRVPTLHHLTEDWVPPVPVPDGANHVTWEIAGAPHADRWAIDHSGSPATDPPQRRNRDEEDARRDHLDDYGQNPDPGAAICAPSSLNAALTSTVFPRRFSLNAATTALRKWARTGAPPTPAARLERNSNGSSAPTRLRRDADGNAIGGLRSPVIDVPIAAYDGEACLIFGTTTPLPPTRLAALYPTHESYVRQLLAATNAAVARGHLICQDAETIMRKASASLVGGIDPFSAAPACVPPDHHH